MRPIRSNGSDWLNIDTYHIYSGSIDFELLKQYASAASILIHQEYTPIFENLSEKYLKSI